MNAINRDETLDGGLHIESATSEDETLGRSGLFNGLVFALILWLVIALAICWLIR